MDSPYFVTEAGAEICEPCAHPCQLCEKGTPKDDRLPWLLDADDRRWVHFDCLGKLQRALGFERSATLIAKRDPAFAAKVGQS
jgi:hypothetical protein